MTELGDNSWMITGLVVVVILAVMFLSAAVKVLPEYERGVLFRLGRLVGARGPGLFIIIPIVDRMLRVDLRVVTMDVPKQELMTRDNVPASVDAVVYFRVVDPNAAIVQVENYVKATSLLSQTTLRSILGQCELDQLLSEREHINQRLQQRLDEATEPWGVKVTTVEVRDVVLPEGMKRAMARQAETERERRAKVINADGEFQAAQKLQDAAKIMADQPISVQLRYLQTLADVAREQHSTIILPVPIDLFTPFLKKMAEKSPDGGAAR